jgi:hypothetical protein
VQVQIQTNFGGQLGSIVGRSDVVPVAIIRGVIIQLATTLGIINAWVISQIFSGLDDKYRVAFGAQLWECYIVSLGSGGGLTLLAVTIPVRLI